MPRSAPSSSRSSDSSSCLGRRSCTCWSLPVVSPAGTISGSPSVSSLISRHSPERDLAGARVWVVPRTHDSRREAAVAGGEYEIVIRGRLGHAFTAWFEQMDVREAAVASGSGADETRLVGYFPNQAALQGFLSEVGELGLELAGVRRLSAG